MSWKSFLAIGAVVAASLSGLWCRGEAAVTFRHLGSIPVGGSGGYVDYLVAAPTGHTLYAGYATGGQLIVIDTGKKAVVARIDGLKDVRSVALVPELHLGFTSNRGEGSVGVIDLESNRLVGKVPDGRGPDAIIYDRGARLVYVADHEGKSGTFIDPVTVKVTAVVRLGGAAEYAQADPATGVVYQNVEERDEVAVIDAKRGAVVARYRTAPGKAPTGLAFDSKSHRLFSACGNDKLVVLDSENGRVIAVVPIGSGVDSIAYDASSHRLYTANGRSGTMTVIRQVTADRYQVEATVPTRKGAHALALDPQERLIYLVHGTTIEIYEYRR